MPNRNRFPAPDQFCAAQAEALPAPPDQVGRMTVVRAIPAFHWQDREPIARGLAVDLDRLSQGRARPGLDLLIKIQVNTQLLQVAAKILRLAELSNRTIRHYRFSKSHLHRG